MSTQKRAMWPLAKVILWCGVCVAIFSFTWISESKKQSVNVADSAMLIQSVNASTASYDQLSWGQVDEAVPESTANTVLLPIKQLRPDLLITEVRFSHVRGIYKAKIQGNTVFFSADGRFFIAGEMYQVTDHQLVNLQEEELRKAEAAFAPQRAKMLGSLNHKDMVIFPAEGETRAQVYVFTDIDCGFCRKLHRQMPEMQALGIEVRYLGFPRAGVNSKSAKKLATTWCADNPREVMTQFKQGKNVALDPCEPNPIADQYELGKNIGVRGTPAIVLKSGQIVPGAVSTQQLIDILKEADLYL